MQYQIYLFSEKAKTIGVWVMGVPAITYLIREIR